MRLHLFITILMLVVLAMTVTNWLTLQTALELQIDSFTQEMQGQALVLTRQLSGSGYFEHSDDPTVNAVIEQTADMWGGRIQVIDRSFRIVRDTYVVDTGKYNISEYVIRCLDGQSSSSFDTEGQFVAFAQPIYEKNFKASVISVSPVEANNVVQDAIEGVLLVTADLQSVVAPFRQAREKDMILMSAATCIAVLVILVIVVYWMRPFKKLVQQIDRAAEGGLKDEVDVHNYAETLRISEAFNRTLKRMQMLDASRQEFVSNVSHELKTPITSIRVLADSLMGMEGAPVELYREFMEDISNEIDRESQIIDDLLSMVRLENKEQTLNISQVSINEMMELLLKRLRPIAKKRNIELLFESFRPVTADIDEVKLNLAVTNLVENAIKYNQDSGWVKVSLNADHKFFYIKVTDNGCGIPEDAVEHIFERFYRVDKARSRETGGTGLGLSITKTIVQLHHGAIKVHSKLQEGTTFVVRIPMIYIKE